MSMQSILAASQSISNMQTMQSVRTQMQSGANILRAQSKQDGGDEQKDAEAAALEEQSNQLLGDLIGEAGDINETLRPEEEEDEAGAAEGSEETAKPPKTDTVEISDAAAKHLSEGSAAKPVVGEAVTYKADGSTTPSAPEKSASEKDAPAKSTPAFKATA